MEFRDLLRRRTVRLFKQQPVDHALLMRMIDAGCLASNAGNKQGLRYCIIQTPELLHQVFDQTRYAGLVAPHRSPEWGISAPAAFIAILTRNEAGFAGYEAVDAGAAIQSMEFAAFESGLGCCWIGAFNHEEVTRILDLPDDMTLRYLLAVGYPDETPRLERIDAGADTAYYLDESNVLHVPKYRAEAVTRTL